MRKMKDSGIEWIGKIPTDWEIVKMKHIGDYINGYAFKPEQWGEEGKPIIRIQDLTQSHTNPNYFSGDIDKKYLVKNGDLLVSWAATLDAFIWTREDAWLNQHIFKAIPKETAVSKSFFYWLIKVAMLHMNNDNKHGIMMQHVTYDLFDNFRIALPPINCQEKISDFVNQKCAEIDAIIAAKEKTNAFLKERRRSIIYEAVTKGLDPTVSMKDSGFEWIGTIPSTWKIRKLRYLGSCSNGISKAGEFFGSGSPFVSYGDVYKNMELPREVSGLIETTAEEQQLYSVEEGDVFFTRTSETIEEVAISSTCMQTIENATFAGFLIRFRPNTELLTKEFSKYYFRSEMHRFFFVKEMNLVTRASLSQDLLKKLPVLLPPVEEQKRIASYLDNECSNIDELIATNESTIEKLKEYRQSVIYEAVTGKVEI